MNNLVFQKENLPQTVEGLNKWRIIGKELLKAHKAKVRAADKMELPEAKEAALDDAQDMAEVLLDVEVRLGEFLEAIPRSYPLGSPGQTKTLPMDIDKRTSHIAQTLASHQDIVEQAKAIARERNEIPTVDKIYHLIKDKPHVSFNSGENEWYTPPEYILAVRKVMGSIDLDPASTEIANQIVGASQYFTKEDDGLTKEWQGRIFMNPPYASDLIKSFAVKFSSHYRNGDIKEGIVLVNNATETTWFAEFVKCAAAIIFTTGRIRFLHPQGNPGAPLQGQALIYFGEQKDLFLEEFSTFGWGAILPE